jgi:4a-hydroxytetrahydrobiopterin dehydratase
VLTRQQASDAVTALGWRYILGVVRTSVRVRSLPEAANVAARAVAAAGDDARHCLRADLRPDRVILTVQSPDTPTVTSRETSLAERVSAAMTGLGLATDADVGADGPRSAQLIEIAIDAVDIPAIRPFWQAVMGYTDEPWAPAPGDGLVDPLGQGPAIWFQQMDAPRPQRNRIHFDISVPHDEARHRIEDALAAGGKLLSDAAAPAFWVLADPEGNEACVTTWQGRDA